MDGVLWRGGKVLDGAAEVLQLLKEADKRIFFATNNATMTREQVRGIRNPQTETRR